MAIWPFTRAGGISSPQNLKKKFSFKPSLESLEGRLTPAIGRTFSMLPTILHVGKLSGEFHTIQAAVDFAKNGDIIKVDSGTYQEQVTINKSIELEGQCNSTIILAPGNLKPSSTANPDAIVRVTGQGTKAEIECFTIEGAVGGTPNLLYGVRVDGNGFACIHDNTITNIINSLNPQQGVAIDVGNSALSSDGTGPQVGKAEIRDNKITNNQRAGIVISNTGSWAEVECNLISDSTSTSLANHPDSQTGVEVSNGAGAEVECNKISNNLNTSNGTGILLFQPSLVEIENNMIFDNDYGIFGSLVAAGANTEVEVNNNVIMSNTFVGIEFDSSSGVAINYNELTKNGSGNVADGGIYLFHSTNNTLKNNESLNNNGSGIFVDAGSTGNLLKNNMFMNNVYNVIGQSADAVDLSNGAGTAGTANTWKSNQGGTFITNSGMTLFGVKSGSGGSGAHLCGHQPDDCMCTVAITCCDEHTKDSGSGGGEKRVFENKRSIWAFGCGSGKVM